MGGVYPDPNGPEVGSAVAGLLVNEVLHHESLSSKQCGNSGECIDTGKNPVLSAVDDYIGVGVHGGAVEVHGGRREVPPAGGRVGVVDHQEGVGGQVVGIG